MVTSQKKDNLGFDGDITEQGGKKPEHSKHDSKMEELDTSYMNVKPSSVKRKFTKKLCLALIFVLLVVAVVITLIIVLNKEKEWLIEKTKIKADRRFTIDEVLLGKYDTRRYYVTWTTDDIFLQYKNGDLTEYKITPTLEHQQRNVILSRLEYMNGGYGKLKSMSPDNKWLLVIKNQVQLYRYSFYGDYFVKDLREDSKRPDRSRPRFIKIKIPDQDATEQIRYCGWANNGSALVFVYKCNVYFIPTLDTANPKQYQLTADGVPKKIFNGVPDWVYEEEMLFATNAISVSNDGKFLSYVRFNATDVPFFKFPIYGPTSDKYTDFEKIAYPKAGVVNPTIKISIVDLQKVLRNESRENYTLSHPQPPSEVAKSEHYYSIMKWSPKNQLFIQWMNRAQNEAYCATYELTNDTGAITQSHKVSNGWIDDDYVKPQFSSDGSYYITMLPKDDFRHLAKVSLKINEEIAWLTEGNFLVVDIKCHDPVNEIIYFRSTEGSPRYRHVYSVDVKTKQRRCVSCEAVKDIDGQTCTYFSVEFSQQCSFAKLTCEGPSVPATYMLNLKTNALKQVTNNSYVKEKLKKRDVPQVIYYTIKSDGFDIPVKESRPADFDEKKKYPVLLDVYGGPGTQKVMDRFDIGFGQYFVSCDIILINFDARGTGYYGYKYMYAVYKRLGYYESIDAIAVARHMRKQKYVDPKKIAIWGWSYGGFYSAITLAMAGDVISTAVSVAPVTDWRYYDTIYTERFMGFPTKEDNLAGYNSTSVMSMAEKFRGKNFLLVHGTADDNVHFQNAAQLASALVKARVKFRTQFYTDKRHGIQSHGHIYYLIADYLMAHFKKVEFSTNSTFGFQ